MKPEGYIIKGKFVSMTDRINIPDALDISVLRC